MTVIMMWLLLFINITPSTEASAATAAAILLLLQLVMLLLILRTYTGDVMASGGSIDTIYCHRYNLSVVVFSLWFLFHLPTLFNLDLINIIYSNCLI